MATGFSSIQETCQATISQEGKAEVENGNGVRTQTPVLTRQWLDSATCQEEGCTHQNDQGELWLHSNCHRGDPTWVRYHDGVITVSCATCSQPIASIAVADGMHPLNLLPQLP